MNLQPESFEEYRKYAYIFMSKTATPEKIASFEEILVKQYNNYVLDTEDQNYFEPKIQDTDDHSLTKYKNQRYKDFGFDEIKENQFYFLITPSFEADNMLVVEKLEENYLLKHIILEEKPLVATLDKSFGDEIFRILDKIVSQARKKKSNMFGLDGTGHTLLCMIGGERKMFYKWSPNENSTSGKVIALLQHLITIIKSPAQEKLTELALKIEEFRLND